MTNHQVLQYQKTFCEFLNNKILSELKEDRVANNEIGGVRLFHVQHKAASNSLNKLTFSLTSKCFLLLSLHRITFPLPSTMIAPPHPCIMLCDDVGMKCRWVGGSLDSLAHFCSTVGSGIVVTDTHSVVSFRFSRFCTCDLCWKQNVKKIQVCVHVFW